MTWYGIKAPNKHNPKKRYAPLNLQNAKAYPFNAPSETETMTLGTVILIELINPGFNPSHTKPVHASDQAFGHA